MPRASPVSMRFGFCLGFIAVSLGTFPLACRLLDIPLDAVWGGIGLGHVPLGKRWLLFGGPAALGFLGGMVGLGLFAHIAQSHSQGEQVLGSLWHYASTGTIVWTLLTFPSLRFSAHGMMALKALPALQATLVVLGPGLASGTLLGVLLLLTQGLRCRGYVALGHHLSRFGPLVVGLATGILQGALLPIPWWLGMVTGGLYPCVVIPWAEAMCRRDGLR